MIQSAGARVRRRRRNVDGITRDIKKLGVGMRCSLLASWPPVEAEAQRSAPPQSRFRPAAVLYIGKSTYGLKRLSAILPERRLRLWGAPFDCLCCRPRSVGVRDDPAPASRHCVGMLEVSGRAGCHGGNLCPWRAISSGSDDTVYGSIFAAARYYRRSLRTLPNKEKRQGAGARGVLCLASSFCSIRAGGDGGFIF